jgi:DnaJ-class molecular chaperone
MEKKNTEKLRNLYKQIRRRSSARTAAEFDAAVKALLTNEGKDAPTAEDFVSAAQRVRFPCRRCAGTGQFIYLVENGVPRGPGGICFRCGGRGWRTDKDERRNYVYDVHYRYVV